MSQTRVAVRQENNVKSHDVRELVATAPPKLARRQSVNVVNPSGLSRPGSLLPQADKSTSSAKPSPPVQRDLEKTETSVSKLFRAVRHVHQKAEKFNFTITLERLWMRVPDTTHLSVHWVRGPKTVHGQHIITLTKNTGNALLNEALSIDATVFSATGLLSRTKKWKSKPSLLRFTKHIPLNTKSPRKQTVLGEVLIDLAESANKIGSTQLMRPLDKCLDPGAKVIFTIATLSMGACETSEESTEPYSGLDASSEVVANNALVTGNAFLKTPSFGRAALNSLNDSSYSVSSPLNASAPLQNGMRKAGSMGSCSSVENSPGRLGRRMGSMAQPSTEAVASSTQEISRTFLKVPDPFDLTSFSTTPKNSLSSTGRSLAPKSPRNSSPPRYRSQESLPPAPPPLTSKTQEVGGLDFTINRVHNFEGNVNDNEDSVTRSGAAAQKLNEEICTLKKSQQQYESKISHLKTEQAELQEQMDRQVCALQATISSLNAQTIDLTQQLASKDTQITDLRLKLAASSRTGENRLDQENQLIQLKNEIESLRKERNNIIEKTKEEQLQYTEEMRVALAGNKALKRQMQVDSQKSKQEIDMLRKRVHDIEVDLQNATINRAQQQQENSAATTGSNNLPASSSYGTNKMLELERELVKAKLEIAEIQTEHEEMMEKAKNKVESLKIAIKEQNEQIFNLEKQIVQMKIRR